jgi:hypothetical protein
MLPMSKIALTASDLIANRDGMLVQLRRIDFMALAMAMWDGHCCGFVRASGR